MTTYTPTDYAEGLIAHHGAAEARAIAQTMLDTLAATERAERDAKLAERYANRRKMALARIEGAGAYWTNGASTAPHHAADSACYYAYTEGWKAECEREADLRARAADNLDRAA